MEGCGKAEPSEPATHNEHTNINSC